MIYDKDQFIWDVINEAITLRENATEEERLKLNILALNPDFKGGCIYGLMTGNCHSPRAIELIQKCCSRYFKQAALHYYIPIEAIIENVNGILVDDFNAVRTAHFKKHFCNIPLHFSAIEVFISMKNKKLNSNLIAYLRGEKRKLDIYF